ncbi:extracellular solute-binding protein [Nocardioides sp. CER19]|uniref:extracellular solute-binding protein n=1 Tax=Nocardioides sp. CER19 TaxID=3038538 RepID=UPI002447846E|nr:extracellular solute-binding protein [Nocardioides sp. CER19]MDH2413168.1 extracellular solute-binding protein [Nocardioides sp. CER19]
MKKTLAVAAVGAMLALSACGSSDGSSNDKSADSGSKTADIRVWLNGADTPDDARAWLKKTFEEQNPGSTLTIEQQEWDGLVEKLTTALSSDKETPDVVEVGNTQAPTFTTAGAFSDLTDNLSDLGGDDLLKGFVDGATIDGKTFAVPYYAGSTYVFYRKDLFKKAGISAVPITTDEFVDDAIKLKKANPTPKNFSGFWLPGQDWRDGAAFLWNTGGDFAVKDGDSWKGALSSPASQEGLATVQKIFKQASGAPADATEADPVTPFCAGEIGMMVRPGWVKGMLEDAKTGCPDIAKNLGVFPVPGADGQPAPVLLGGSDLGISAKSQHQGLAEKALALMLSEDYQSILAHHGLTPAKNSLSSKLGSDEYAQATIAAASNAKLTPAAANWALIEGDRTLEDLFSQIAQGGDLASLADKADSHIAEVLNK